MVLNAFLDLQSGFFPTNFASENLYARLYLQYVQHAPSRIILSDTTTQIIFGLEHHSLSNSVNSLLYSYVTSSL